MAEPKQRVDVLIGGAGFAGLALALALRQALGPVFGIAIADPALAHPAQDARASAIVAAARRLLETIGVWQAVAEDAQPILRMNITDSRLDDAVRPVFLRFDGDVSDPIDQPGPEPFAHMVENGPLLAALLEKARASGITLLPHAIADFHGTGRSSHLSRDNSRIEGPKSGRPSPQRGEGWGEGATTLSKDPNPSPQPSPSGRGSRPSQPHENRTTRRGSSHYIDVQLSNGTRVAARLLVAADGARSTIRERAGIATHGWDYSQSSIVTTVAHERDHDGCAEEHFLPAGPFAILPLKGRRSSIVWTEEEREAERIVALPDRDFHAELERRFGLHLGEIEAVGPRRAFPLSLAVARAFVAERVALVGDAAHVIHPIAGQGLNMGLKDVAALAEVIVDAARLGIDIGAAATLEHYQRWRRFDTMAMGVATDGLNRLFSNRSSVLRLMRDVGLGLVDRLPALKQVFIREAAGLVGEVPKLLRGESL